MMSCKCKECGEEFSSEKSLHAHIKKHGFYVADYYVKHYPRFNKLNGNPIQFKNKEQYFSTDFSNRNQMRKWCEESDKSEVRNYILKTLAERIRLKEWKYAPNHLELYKTKLPDINIYKKHNKNKAIEPMNPDAPVVMGSASMPAPVWVPATSITPPIILFGFIITHFFM